MRLRPRCSRGDQENKCRNCRAVIGRAAPLRRPRPSGAIDDDMRAGDVVRQIGAQVHHHIRHFLRRSIAPGRDASTVRVMYRHRMRRIYLRFQRAHHSRLDRAGTDGIHPYPQTSDIGGRDLGQPQHRMLGCDIGAMPGPPNNPAVDEVLTMAPCLCFQHYRQHMPHAKKYAP